MARDLGFKVSYATQIPGSRKHADLLIYNISDDFMATAIDVSVRNPFVTGAKRVLPSGKRDVLYHLIRAEKSKGEKYSKAYADLGRGFEAFVVSSTGMVSSGAKKIIACFAKRYALQYFVSVSVALRRITDFIVGSTLRQVAQNCLKAQARIYELMTALPSDS